MKTIIIFILSFLICCGKEEPKELLQKLTKHSDNIDSILDQRDLYLNLIKERQGIHGFISPNNCDSLLFSSLASFAGVNILLKHAKSEKTNQWFRTPFKDCYRNEQKNIESPRRSKSTISRDMFAGLFYALYYNGVLAELESIRQYGKKNHWIMGQGLWSRTFMSINMQRTLYILTDKSFKGLPDYWSDPKKDHSRHVVALHISLRGMKLKALNKNQFKILEIFVKEDPGNPLFQLAYHLFSDGNQSETIKILKNEQYWPRNRLPNSSDRCARWIPERDQSHRQPCPKEKQQHSGGDFLFIAKLLEMTKK